MLIAELTHSHIGARLQCVARLFNFIADAGTNLMVGGNRAATNNAKTDHSGDG
jgi:uncharacterized Zn-binding protein involved in type VI secretion